MRKVLQFDFSNLRGDFFGGLTAGIVALPLALAFGLSSGLGPDAGLYGAIFIAFFAALFGGTPTQISGPTAPMTAVSMLVVAGIIQANNGNVTEALPAILTVFFIAGVILIVLGITGIGEYIKYIPYPVVSGFMTAIGVIIIITQLLPILGYYPTEDVEVVQSFKVQAEDVLLEKILRDEADEGILVLEDFKETIKRAEATTDEDIMLEAKVLASKDSSGVLGSLKYLLKAVLNVNWVELILALLTIFIIYGFRRITKAIPSTLVALLAVSGAAYFLSQQGMLNYRPIPEIPGGFPALRTEIFTNFQFSAVTPYLLTAFSLALLGAIDSLLTSVVADNITKTKHSPNQELIGQGIGNSIAAMFGGIPGAGATIRTVVNINAGGKTKISGMIAGILLLIILLALGPIASQIPAAVLAGILMTVGIGVMDYKGLKALPVMPWPKIVILLGTMLLATFWNLIFAVGIGMIASALFFMKRMADIAAENSAISSLEEINLSNLDWEDESGLPNNLKEEVYIKHLNGPLFFGNINDFKELAMKIPKTSTHVVIRMDRVPYIDQSGLFALEDVLIDMVNNDIEVLIVGLNEEPRLRMETINIIPDLVPEALLFENFADCLSYIRTNVKDVYPA